jgi:hypothetical protein
VYFNNHLLFLKGKGINLEEVLNGIGLIKSIPLYYTLYWYQKVELSSVNETIYYFPNYVFDENWDPILHANTYDFINYLFYELSYLGYYSLNLIDNDVYSGYKAPNRFLLKIDKQWNIVKEQNFNSYCYDSTNYLLYATTNYFYGIQVFNLNLSLVDFISLSDYDQYEIINVHKNQLFLSRSYDRKIIVIGNKKIINEFYACSDYSSKKLSILFDDFDNMLVWCPVPDCKSALYLYSINGTYKNFERRINPNYANFKSITFDSKSRIIVAGTNYINIYASSQNYLNDYYDLSVLNECYFVRRTPSMTTETITTMTTMTSTMW